MKTNRSFASCIATLALANILLAITSARADTFTATFTNSFGDAIWQRDAHIGQIGNPGDPDIPGNWNTGAFPHNGHSINDPNTGLQVPGPNPLYNTVININTPCTLGGEVIVETLDIAAISTLNIAGGAIFNWRASPGLSNNGTIVVNSGALNMATGLRFSASTENPASVVSGSGEIQLNGINFNDAFFKNGNQNTGGGGTLTLSASHLIHGRGDVLLDDNAAVSIHNGTISADMNGAELRVFLSGQTGNKNNGMMKATNGGILFLENGRLDQTGGGTILAETGSTVVLGNIGFANNVFRIIGGTIGTVGTGMIEAGTVSFDGTTHSGAMQLQPGRTLRVETGGLVNNGTILVNSTAGDDDALFYFVGNTTTETSFLNGSGSLQLNGINSNDARIYNGNFNSGSGETVIHGSTHLIHGRGDIAMSEAGAVFINNGTIDADVAAAELRVFLSGQFGNQNNGTMKATNEATLFLENGRLDQSGGGVILAEEGSTVLLGNRGFANNVFGLVGGTLNTTSNGVVKGGTVALNGNIANLGTFVVPADNRTFISTLTLTNDGTMTLEAANSEFRFDAGTSISGTGAIILTNGATMNVNGQSITNGSNHTIKGNGIIAMNGGSLTNNGTFAPGLSPGKITVSGNYTQGSTGVLNLEIGGHTPVTQYDQLAVTGNAALNGTLNVSLINGFLPAVGDVFQIISTGSFSGAFTTINTTGFTGQVNYNAGSITMTVLTVGGTPTPSQLLNIATRMRVQSGENVLIGGFIVTGTDPKQVIIRAIGPSLASFFPDALANPTLELFQGSTLLASNDNWRVPSQNESEVLATGIPPTDDLESALVRTLQPGAYTAIVRGSGGASGIGLVEAYDLAQGANSKLANISTRGFVETDSNVMIGGLIIGPAGGSNATVVVRAIGPSLSDFGIPGALQNPALELKDANGTTLISNDDWQQGQPTEIQQAGLAPTDTRESALLATLAPGAYTAIVRGAGNTTGVGLVEVYHLQ